MGVREMLPNLTPEQQSAVEMQSNRFTVRAAAGAGKTRVLVARYLRYVVEVGLRPDQILTITFTRKAAAEMKRRIVKTLIEAGRPLEAQVAETGPIQTVHGFCERVLRECAIEAGVDTDFVVLDEAESARIKEQCLAEAIASARENSPADTLIKKLAGRRKFEISDPSGVLKEAVRTATSALRDSGLPRQFWAEIYASPESALCHWQEKWVETMDESLVEELNAQEPSLPFGTRLFRALKQLRRRVPKGLTDADGAQASEAAERETAADSCGLVEIACASWESFEGKLAAAKALDFSSLEGRTVALLATSPFVRERLRNQYRVLLVDEAQDLSPMQHRLIETLGIGDEMLVGDAQQSIYGFRQSDVRLFHSRVETTETVDLSKNHRSVEGVLTYIDATFSALWGTSYLPMRDSPSGPAPFEGVEIWPLQRRDSEQVARWIADLVAETGRPGDIAVLVRASRFAQELLPRLTRRGVPAQIAGGTEKFFVRLEVRDIANALLSLYRPEEDVALLSTLRGPFAGVSVDSIALLAQNGHVFEALSSFEPAVESDKEKIAKFLGWFGPLQARVHRLLAFQALAELLAASPYLPNIARKPRAGQVLANVKKLLRMAAERPHLDPFDFVDWVREIRELRHKEGDAPATDFDEGAVTLMTIHKSKGLEFPIVVLPDTHSPMSGRKKEVEVERTQAILTCRFEAGVSAFHDWNSECRKEREMAEEWRIVYVAMTRAKERLCVVAHPKSRSQSVAERLAYLTPWDNARTPGVRVREISPE
ncbi:MAG: hypothetical protein DCC46_12130 [Armatimonadetes bacterium]|nr:MAG: hypothetical protein DCC46_12130 [Armatimonadota bacterium]